MDPKKNVVYGVSNESRTSIIGHYDSLDAANNMVDKNWPYIVELTVTKVFKRGTDYVEVKESDV